MEEALRVTPTEMNKAVADHRTILRLNGHKPTMQDSRDAIAQEQIDKMLRLGYHKDATVKVSLQEAFRELAEVTSEHYADIKGESLANNIRNILDYETDLCLNPTVVGEDDCGYETESMACRECQIAQITALLKPPTTT